MELRKGYKQSEIGDLPNEWDVKTIHSITTDMLQGVNTAIDIPEYVEDGIPMLKANNIIDGTVNFSTSDHISHKTFLKYSDRFKLRKFDFLFSNIGARLGTGSLLKSDIPCTFAWNVMRITPDQKVINPAFLEHIMNSKIMNNQIMNNISGSGMGFVPKNVLRNLQLPLPPTKAEQTAIATALTDADALISSLEKLIEKKRNIKQGAMQQLLKPKKGWVTKKFKDKDVTNLITCGIAATPEYVSEFIGYPFLSSTNVKDGKIVWSNYKHIGKDLHSMLYRNNPPQRGDILYSRVGTIGEAAIVEVDFEFSVYVSLTLIKTGKLIYNEYLKHLLNSDHYKKLAQSTVLMGGGVGNLNVNVVREWDIPVPPINEQKEIAEILNNITEEISALEKKLSKSKMLKQGMMQELLTGKIRLV